MKEQDASLVDDWEDAVAGAHALSDAANAQPWNEEVFREGFDCYVLETLDLVLRTRTQEAAVRTWTGEAFHRDRGGGD
jgi:hypothetical protein